MEPLSPHTLCLVLTLYITSDLERSYKFINPSLVILNWLFIFCWQEVLHKLDEWMQPTPVGPHIFAFPRLIFKSTWYIYTAVIIFPLTPGEVQLFDILITFTLAV